MLLNSSEYTEESSRLMSDDAPASFRCPTWLLVGAVVKDSFFSVLAVAAAAGAIAEAL